MWDLFRLIEPPLFESSTNQQIWLVIGPQDFWPETDSIKLDNEVKELDEKVVDGASVKPPTLGTSGPPQRKGYAWIGFLWISHTTEEFVWFLYLKEPSIHLIFGEGWLVKGFYDIFNFQGWHGVQGGQDEIDPHLREQQSSWLHKSWLATSVGIPLKHMIGL